MGHSGSNLFGAALGVTTTVLILKQLLGNNMNPTGR